MVKHSKEYRARKNAENYNAWEESGGGYPGAAISFEEFKKNKTKKKKKRRKRNIEW